MLPIEKLREVERLNARGLSQHQIARATGVSRHTIASVQKGEISSTQRNQRRRKYQRPSSSYNSCPWEKCDGCGCIVQKPCLKCEPPQEAQPVAVPWLPTCERCGGPRSWNGTKTLCRTCQAELADNAIEEVLPLERIYAEAQRLRLARDGQLRSDHVGTPTFSRGLHWEHLAVTDQDEGGD